MTFFLVSDTLHGHPKWRQLSPEAKALWTTAGSHSCAYLTDGVIDRTEHAPTIALETFGLTADTIERFERAAAELVARRLWRSHRRGWQFHQWLEINRAAEDERMRRMRKQRTHQLHNTAAGKRLKGQVIERDRNLCRYCACVLDPRGGRAADGRTFDHVDPTGPNSLANVVLACSDCQRRKSDQLPEHAGMELLPAPTHATADSCADRSADGPSLHRAGIRTGEERRGVERGGEESLSTTAPRTDPRTDPRVRP